MILLFYKLVLRYPYLLHHIGLSHLSLHEFDHECGKFVVLGSIVDVIVSLVDIVDGSDHPVDLVRS